MIHRVYTELEQRNPEACDAVNEAVRDVMATLRRHDFKTSGDDRVEYVAEAIAVYLKACNPERL